MATNTAKNNKYGYAASFALDFRRNVSATFGVDLVADAIIGRIVDDLWYAPDYGINLARKIRYQDPDTYGEIAVATEVEIRKDSRVQQVTVTIDPPDNSNNVSVLITGITSENQSFDLVGKLNTFDASDFSFSQV